MAKKFRVEVDVNCEMVFEVMADTLEDAQKMVVKNLKVHGELSGVPKDFYRIVFKDIYGLDILYDT